MQMFLWGVAGLAVAAVLAGWLTWGQGSGAVSDPLPDFATLRLAATPNQYLMLPPGYRAQATPQAESPVFDVPVDRLEQVALEVIRTRPRTIQVASDQEHRSYAFVQRTPLLRFPDTVTVRFVDEGGGRSSMAIYSRSKIGKSDLGANRKRVERWLEAIKGRLR